MTLTYKGREYHLRYARLGTATVATRASPLARLYEGSSKFGEKRMTEYSIDLRHRQTGETIATIICAAADGHALRLESRLDAERLREVSHVCLDAYESDTRLVFSSWCDKAPLFQDANGRNRLWLPEGEYGSIRVVIKNRSPGKSGELQDSINICVWIEPVS